MSSSVARRAAPPPATLRLYHARYDGWGNRLQQSAVKGSVPTITTITAPATNQIQAHGYDANGNPTYTPQQGNMTYDVLNRLTTVAADVYGYDSSNKRVWKNDEFTFWGATGERVGRYTAVKLVDNVTTGTPVHKFVFQRVSVDEYFGGRRLTQQDRLGSVGSYYPYGEARSGTVSNSDSFATYYRDSTGLDYANQRYFNAGLGRFMSADPSSKENAAGSGSWNKYAYTGGDPINYSDPSGLARCKVVGWSNYLPHPDTAEVTTASIHCESEGGSVVAPFTVTLSGYFGYGDLLRVALDKERGFGPGLDQTEWDNTLGQLNAARYSIMADGLTKGCIDVLKKSFGALNQNFLNGSGVIDFSGVIVGALADAQFLNGFTNPAVTQEFKLNSQTEYVHAYTGNGREIYWRPGDMYLQSTSGWARANVLHEVLHKWYKDDKLQEFLIGKDAIGQPSDNITKELNSQCFK